jgi:hypothetical protein
MEIGPARRVIEVEPVSIPVPEPVPDPELVPDTEPDRTPLEPATDGSTVVR